ncbi:MAG: hypothetical protein HYX75_08315 [Acidobacteria bacterium]|nr:hypothetical protein [Acidobacteriota bacterium]
MNAEVVYRLVKKDCSLMRGPLCVYTLVASVAAFLPALGPGWKGMGVTLALNVLIGLSFHVTLGTVLGEREKKTLPFVMSLPLRPQEVALAKLVSSYAMFFLPAAAAAVSLVFLSPVDIFTAMAHDGRSIGAHVLGWCAYFALVLGAWTVFFSTVLASAIVTESLGWTVAVITTLLFVFGNGLLQLAPRLALFVRYIRDLQRGGPSLPLTLGVELLAIALVIAATLWLQSRKTSFV